MRVVDQLLGLATLSRDGAAPSLRAHRSQPVTDRRQLLLQGLRQVAARGEIAEEVPRIVVLHLSLGIDEVRALSKRFIPS